jgi:hypothetical protein
MSIVIGYDVTGANLARVPRGQLAGYSTGTGGVPWTATQWAEHPGALRYCQDTGATDRTADVLDVERGAATNADAPAWYRDTLHNYVIGARPGQREPAFYTSQSNVTPLVNVLVGAGISNGPRLIVANWNLTESQSEADVIDASGPFPVAGVQFASLEFYDIDVWSSGWLARVSVHPPHLVSAELVAHMSDGTTRSYTV